MTYTHTIYASYLGYITQAVVNNFVPLLFVTFSSAFGLNLEKIALITILNFGLQLLVDLLSPPVVEKIGYRLSLILAHVFAFLGLISLAFLPSLLPDAFSGILISVMLYALGGGLIEVLISPVVESCPTEKKEAAMSLLHSFYCWGHAGVVLLSLLFFKFFGIDKWPLLSLLWALLPLFNAFYFAFVPLFPVTKENEKLSLKALLSKGTFWLFVLLMICAGASEQAMSQWASAFAEKALGLSKILGDALGPCTFALCMGSSRALYGKFSSRLPLKNAMIFSALLCITSYLLASLAANPVLALVGCALCGFSVGIFWPGTFSLSASSISGGGTAMYALLALAGDLGCALGPWTVGFSSEHWGGNLKKGLLFAMIFPLVLGICVFLSRKKKNL